MPQVSVIIPTFNRASVLERALDSVLRQTFTDWELIVVDDGSSDHTHERFNQWRVRQDLRQNVTFLQTLNQGVSRARNMGAQNATAPWLAFLDSDDEWLSNKLELQFALTSDFQLVHGEEIWIRRGQRVNPMRKHAKTGGRIFSRCVDLCCVSPSTVLLSRALFMSENGFRADFPVCEDYELWLRLCARWNVGFVTTPLIIKYGGHPDQLSLSHRVQDFYRVKALIPFVENTTISSSERLHVLKTIQLKCDILLKGYAKHDNHQDEGQVQDWREVAASALTQFHNTHSATERFPRSLSTLNL